MLVNAIFGGYFIIYIFDNFASSRRATSYDWLKKATPKIVDIKRRSDSLSNYIVANCNVLIFVIC